MAEFNKEDLLKVAKLSALDLNEQEIESFGEQLKKVLNFIDQITEVKTQGNIEQVRNKNIFREDEILSSNAKDVINQAPEQQLNYFVVPKILNETKGA
ncbi:MAG: Aspartyl/glutamyl-tRNA(Asn/Gln) amidotransferase subunit C [candidate division TM6 bacterium GW2011_GWF2_37_49]|nr:MAG: Aspartyl/glutamyl-tRNA(Asn/Gln) amidotransferase subunit C [candidate division TM6 bacterium GW2011_GWF2_37_49]